MLWVFITKPPINVDHLIAVQKCESKTTLLIDFNFCDWDDTHSNWMSYQGQVYEQKQNSLSSPHEVERISHDTQQKALWL